MTAKLPQEYLDENRIEYTEAPYTTYMLETDETVKAELAERLEAEYQSPEDKEITEILENIATPDDFFKWMRKELNGRNRDLLQRRMLENEDLLTEMIKKRALTNMLDDFVESATHFFINCQADPCPWIIENYDRMRNPYTQSMMCLVLGFRGDESHIDFLLKQAYDLMNKFPEESFDQGPIVALYMIGGVEKFLK